MNFSSRFKAAFSFYIRSIPFVAILLFIPQGECLASVYLSDFANLHLNLRGGEPDPAEEHILDDTGINLLNGNVFFNEPLSITYPVTDFLEYKFGLRYSSDIWRFSTTTTWQTPSNAGLGFDVSFGRIPPLSGFLCFKQLRTEIYPGLEQIVVKRTGDVVAREIADGQVVVTCYPFHLHYAFEDGRKMSIDARISQIWEKRSDGYRIVHEHPSTVYNGS